MRAVHADSTSQSHGHQPFTSPHRSRRRRAHGNAGTGAPPPGGRWERWSAMRGTPRPAPDRRALPWHAIAGLQEVFLIGSTRRGNRVLGMAQYLPAGVATFRARGRARAGVGHQLANLWNSVVNTSVAGSLARSVSSWSIGGQAG
jgi:hypothetical protein